MDLQVKAPATNSDALSLISSTYRVGRKEMTPSSCPLTSTHAVWHGHGYTHIETQLHTHTYTQSKLIYAIKNLNQR